MLEVKEIQAEDLKTPGDLASAVEYYRAIQEELKRLQLSKDLAKEAILAKFREKGMRYFKTENLIARVDTRTGRQWIDVKEAAVLLDPDTFLKLLKQGETIVILSVRPIKSEE